MSVNRRPQRDLDDPPYGSPNRILRAVGNAYRYAPHAIRAVNYARRLFTSPAQPTTKRPTAPPGGPTKLTPSNGSGSTKMGYKRKRRVVKPSIKKRVKQLEKKLKKQNWHKHVYKHEATFQVSSIVNQCSYNSGLLWNATIIEQMLQYVPYLNPAAPTVASNFDGRDIKANTKWALELATKTTIRNNYLYPANIRCYIVKPKLTTMNVPETDMLNGAAKQANPSIASYVGVTMYPTDFEDFNANWKIIKSCDMQLKSGDECVMPYSEEVKYDQELQDVNTDTYNRKYTRFIFVRIVGVVCHDQTTTTNIGYSPAKVDAVISRTFRYKKATEAPGRTIHQWSSLGSVSTAVVGVASAEVENAL